MRKNFGPRNLLFPLPVLIVGTYDEKAVPNAMNAAWGGLSSTNEICMCIGDNHKTYKNLMKTKAFTVSIGTRKTEKACDYVGCVSGNSVKNKLDVCKWHTTKSEFVNAPIIEELPFTLECKMISYDKKTERLLGEIVNVSCDTSVMTKGKIDLNKLEPILFEGEHNTYNLIGKKVGNAFKDYKKIKK